MGIDTGKLLTNAQINDLAVNNGYEYRVLKSIIQVESGQHGFHPVTGKIIIQFEPSWFKRLYKGWAGETRHITWQSNKVGNQNAEWKAFNSAFAVNADAAMKSTSIGMMQLMGFHYAETGFKKVGDMWDFAKESEYNQVLLAIKWIKTVRSLDLAIKNKDWQKIAYYYNGANYRSFRYDTRLFSAYRLTGDY
ncbi:N-acetylmuramidase family protein [Niastella caeni]|uniref:N-acetylmuramidase family protein n=1 Tax=Niastella caeni TaxID=2569763 RepID=A0A4S8HI50_9BACT|nr:N-acetylmuramidase family protein [Niastella caeni]THU34880.1 N-acetylmuramidase family protein [Niastella caeni]